MWSRVCIAAVIAFVGLLPGAWVQGEEDPAPRFKASELLSAAVVKGPHHQVAPDVKTEGFFHAFAISSTFGAFQATGRTQLTVRLQEIAALAALDEVSKTEVFLKSAGKSIVKVGQGAAAVVTDPVGTAKGVGAGVKRAGVNLGRRTQRAVASAGDDTPSDGGGNAAADAASSAMGVTGAMRQWARKVGVDPYTTNTVLRKALEDIGRVDAAGSLVTKIAVPVPAPVGAISSIGDVVWSKDPEEVRKINETSLRALGVPDDIAKRLFANRSYTLTSQTRFAAALAKVKAKGIADYVSTAAAAADAREALVFRRERRNAPAGACANAHRRAPHRLTRPGRRGCRGRCESIAAPRLDLVDAGDPQRHTRDRRPCPERTGEHSSRGTGDRTRVRSGSQRVHQGRLDRDEVSGETLRPNAE